jgi:hypothetical protein
MRGKHVDVFLGGELLLPAVDACLRACKEAGGKPVLRFFRRYIYSAWQTLRVHSRRNDTRVDALHSAVEARTGLALHLVVAKDSDAAAGLQQRGDPLYASLWIELVISAGGEGKFFAIA